MRLASSNRVVLTAMAALALGACTNLAAAPVTGLPESGSEALQLGSHAEIIAATQGLPASVIAAGDGSIIAAGAGNVIAAGGGNVIAAGAGNVIAAGGGNVIAAGGGNLGAGVSGLDGGGAAVGEDLAVAKLLDGKQEAGFVSHGPGRVALHVNFPQAVPLRSIRLIFDARLPMPSHHVLDLYDAEGKALATHLVRHGQGDLRSGAVLVPLSDRVQPAALRILGPEGASMGVKEIEFLDVVGKSVAAGATVALKTRAQL